MCMHSLSLGYVAKTRRLAVNLCICAVYVNINYNKLNDFRCYRILCHCAATMISVWSSSYYVHSVDRQSLFSEFCSSYSFFCYSLHLKLTCVYCCVRLRSFVHSLIFWSTHVCVPIAAVRCIIFMSCMSGKRLSAGLQIWIMHIYTDCQ